MDLHQRSGGVGVTGNIYDDVRDAINDTVMQVAYPIPRRERIAMAALQGILAGPPNDVPYHPELAVVHALRHADALIAALDKEVE